jgi:4-hydroxy-tetrahydrodipicolinate synthase
MLKFRNFEPKGVIPACLLPFKDDLTIDEQAFRKHLRDVTGVAGVAAITINAHSTEVASCTYDEQRRVLEIAMDEVGDRIPVIHGVYAEGGLEAARLARLGEQCGASGLLVFPPNSFALGAMSRPEMAIAHFQTIAEATDLPFIAFQYRRESGQGYALDTLLKLAEEVPSFRAIKDWCYDVVLHERHIRILQNLPRPIHVLTTHSAWLLSSLVLGCNGLLSGAGSVIADLHVALFKAVQDNDLARAREVYNRIYPLAEVFYADPFVDMHNRMKEALVILGRIPRAALRPPLLKLSDGEIARIRRGLELARIRTEGAFAAAGHYR